MKQVASLRYGVIFKKAFCDPVIFKGFVKDILNIELEIDHVETEKSFSPPIGRVDARFDLFAEDEKNRLVVDIQHVRYGDHYDRFLHYHCVAILEQVAKAEDYRPRLQVYTIVMLTSGDKHKTDVAISDFTPRDLQGNALEETEHKIIYLCPKYVTDETPEPYREWLRAINDTLDGEVDESQYSHALIQQVFDHIEQDKVSPQERARMFDEHGQALLRQEKFEKGKAEGKIEGKAEGKIEGKAEGERTKTLAIVQAMLQKGMALDLISEVTGLPIAEIEQLAVK